MKNRFLIQFIGSALVVALVSTALFYGMCHGLTKTSKDSIGKFNYLLADTIHYDNVFIGPSTVHLGVNPVLFDSANRHQTNSFNAGMDGIRLVEMDLIIHKFIKAHGAPKTIYLNFAENTLVTDSSIWFFAQYYPYLKDPEFATLIKHDKRLLYGEYFPPLAITYFNDPLRSSGLSGMFSSKPEFKELIKDRGYAKSSRAIKEEAGENFLAFRESEDGWQLLKNVVAFCGQQNITLTFLIVPEYHVQLTDASLAVTNKLKAYGNEHNIQTINLLTDPRFASNTLFSDRRHLNVNGAHLLSSILAMGEFDN